MNPLAGLYASIVAVRNTLYDRESFASERLRGPVVSVGNISAGGAGKTPFVIALGHELTRRTLSFDILSRGYRRKLKGILQLPPAADPSLYGDEPALLQHELNVPVFLGASRVDAGRLAEQEAVRIHLLDDAFQHRHLHRDFDIVILSPSDLTDRPLPAGRLREPLQSLGRADAVVIPHDFHQSIPHFNGHIWRIRRHLRFSHQPSPRPLVFCGLARPDQFFHLLDDHGVDLGPTLQLRDHHTYSDADVRSLLALANAHNCESLVTTAKDAIKLRRITNPDFQRRLCVAELTTEILDLETVTNQLLQTLRQRCPDWFAS